MQKTSDGGLTWAPINNGLTAENLTAVMIDPHDPTTIFAAGWTSGLWKSTDNGVSWFNLQPDMVYIEKLVADLLRPDTLYANGSRSVDGGVSFTDLGVHKITLDPNNQDVLYSHYGYGSSVAKSVDWGATWNSLSTPLIENEGISTLIVDPLNPNLVYLATMRTARVFKSTTGGASWTGAYNGLPPCQGTPVCSKSIQVLSADPVTSGVLYAGLDEYGLGIYKTTDFGAHWYPKNNGLTNLDIRSISIDPTTPSTVYAGTYGGEVFRSLDGGEHWSPYNNGLQGSTNLLADNLSDSDSRPGRIVIWQR